MLAFLYSTHDVDLVQVVSSRDHSGDPTSWDLVAWCESERMNISYRLGRILPPFDMLPLFLSVLGAESLLKLFTGACLSVFNVHALFHFLSSLILVVFTFSTHDLSTHLRSKRVVLCACLSHLLCISPSPHHTLKCFRSPYTPTRLQLERLGRN